MGAKAPQITSLTIVYSTVYLGTDQSKHQTSIGEFPAQRTSNAENVSIWWRHHDFLPILDTTFCLIVYPLNFTIQLHTSSAQ